MEEKYIVINLCLALSTVHWLAFATQVILMPYVSEDLRLSPAKFALIQSTFALGQMIGSLYFGRLCKLGIRKALCLALLSASLTCMLTSICTGFYSFLLSRVTFFLAHAPIALQAIVSKLTDERERSIYFGRLGASAGIGFTMGSLIAGVLATTSGLYMTNLICSLILLLASILAYFSVPKNLAHGEQKGVGGESTNIHKNYLRLLKVPSVAANNFVKICSSVPFQLLTSIFGIYLIEVHNVSPLLNAYLSVFGGLCATSSNVFAIPRFAASFSSDILGVQAGLLILIIFGFGLVFVQKFVHFFLIWPLLSFGFTFVGSFCDLSIARLLSSDDYAEALSLSMFIDSGVRVISPSIAEYVLDQLGFNSFGYLFIGLNLLCIVFVRTFSHYF